MGSINSETLEVIKTVPTYYWMKWLYYLQQRIYLGVDEQKRCRDSSYRDSFCAVVTGCTAKGLPGLKSLQRCYHLFLPYILFKDINFLLTHNVCSDRANFHAKSNK